MPPWDAYKPQQPAAPAAEPAGPAPTFDAIPDQSAAPIDKPAAPAPAKEGPWDAFKRQDIVKAMPLAGEMPMTGPMMDEYVKNSAVGKIIDAFGEGFGPVDAKNAIGIQPGGEAEKELQRRGLLTDMNQTHYDLMKSFNEGIVRPTAFAGDIVLRTMSGAFKAGQEALKQGTEFLATPLLNSGLAKALLPGEMTGPQGAERLGRDIAGIPEALQGHPHGIDPARVPEPPRAPEPIRVAKSLDVIGKGEAGWKGFSETTTDTADEQVKRWREAMEDYNTPPTPGVAMERMAEKAEAAPKGADIHQAAREIAPDTFREYDALQTRRDTYRRWIGDMTEQLPENPAIKETQEKIDTILGKVKGNEERLTKAAAERLQQARDELDALPQKIDTPDMTRIRDEMQKLDYRMRDLAPEVSDAYREARERVPAEEPAPAEIPGEGPEIEPAQQPEVPGREPVQEPEPLEAAVAKPVLNIAEDVSKKLVDVGRPKEEADAAAALIAAHYEARAARFKGMKGTAADLYDREAPEIRAGRGRAKELTGEVEFAQSVLPSELVKVGRKHGFDSEEFKRAEADWVEASRGIDDQEKAQTTVRKDLVPTLAGQLQGEAGLATPQITSEAAYIKAATSQKFPANTNRFQALRDQSSKVREFEQPATPEDKQRYAADVARARRGDAKDSGQLVKISGLPKALQAVGLPLRELRMPMSVLAKIAAKHELPERVIKRLPDLVADPVMIFESATQPGTFVMALNATDGEGRPLIASVQPQRAHNMVTSVYGRNGAEDFLARQIQDGRLRYRDESLLKNEGAAWAGPHRATIARGVPDGIKKVLSPADLVKPGTGPKDLAQPSRGKITFRPGSAEGARATITLLRDADASTFMHETGHAWLEELARDANDDRAPPELVKDARTVRDWLGAEEDRPFTRKQHEQFARGFERYLMEGRAPTRALADVFAKFKDWLTRIYETVSRLRSPINDDIRDVFDRLVSKGREDVTIAPEPKEATGTLGARHEKLAETTPPEEAQAVAETVRTEADEHAEKEDKTVHAEITGPQVSGEQPSAGEPVEPAGRGDAAGGARGNPPADQEAGGDGTGGRPAAQEGEADRGAGAEREGGAEPAAEGAGPRADGDDASPAGGPHDDRPDAVVDANLAGNIRLENLPGDTAIKDRLRQFAADNADWVAARRGVVSDQEVMDLADSMGIDARKLNIQKLRDMSVEDGIPLAARIVGGRQEMIAAVGKAVTAAEKASQSGSLDDIQAYVQAKTWALHVAETIAGITAEMGRGLRGFRDISGTGPKDYKQIIEFMQNATGRTPEQLRAEAAGMAQMKTPSQAAKFAQDSVKPKFKDMFLSYFINNLISGPLTHGAYMAGNEVYQLVKIGATTPVAAAIGAAREALGRAEPGERVYMREAWAQMYAHGRAAIYGIGPAYQAFKTGIVTMKGDLHGEGAMPGGENALRRQIIPGTAGYVLETPSRAVSAIHMMHYGMNYEAEVSRLAFRSAMGEGLEVGSHAFNEYLARFTQDTPEPVMEEAHKQAMRMVLMRRPAYDSSAAALQRFVNSHVLAKLVVPFMQIGGSILREGYLEHTPLGALVDPEIKARLRGEQGDAARDTQYAQMAVGTGVSLGVLFAAGQGIVTGGGPTDPKQRAALEMTGWQPYSLHLGEKYIPYRKYLGPLGPLVGGVANMQEVGHAMSEGDYTAAATAAIVGFSEVIADETWMRGVANFLDAVRHWDRDGGKYLRNLAMDFIPFSVGMSQISRLIDPERRDVRSWPDAAQAHIPVASEGLHPVRDIFGNAMPSRTMLSPSTLNDDPVLRDLIATDSFPSRLERKIRGVDLTEQQYDDFSRIAGRLTRMALVQVINQPGWADVPLGIRHEVLTKVVEKSREAARAQIMLQAVGSDNDIMKKAAANKLEKLRRGQPVEGPAWGTEGAGQTKLTPELANSAPAAVFR